MEIFADGGPEITQAETKRAETILQKIAKVALDRIAREHKSKEFGHYTKLRRYVESAFETALRNQCNKVLAAAKVKPAVHKELETQKQRKRQARKDLADELRQARQQLRVLRWTIQHAEEAAKKATEEKAREHRKAWAAKLITAKLRLKALHDAHVTQSQKIADYEMRTREATDTGQYPDIPRPTYRPTAEGLGLPETAGIYFLWVDGVVEYVGQTKRLCNRLRLGSHHVLNAGHQISFLCFPERELSWAECHYIGKARPQANFGRRAAHYDAGT